MRATCWAGTGAAIRPEGDNEREKREGKQYVALCEL